MRFLTAAIALALATPSVAGAATICSYDPAGKAGFYYNMLSDFAVEAAGWGVQVDVRAYTDEETAAKDYEAGQCDGVVATGVRLQRFNRFPSTIEAIGAAPSYSILKQMVDALATYPSAAARLRSGDHETVGFIPVGAVYLFVRDREINTVEEIAGIRIATMDYDQPSMVMVGRAGAVAVPADLGSIGPKFNNGDVDACYVTGPAYEPFEIWRGMEPDGGVLRYPLAQATLQVMLRAPSFPEGFTAKARTWFAQSFDKGLAEVKRTEAGIPEKYWVDVSKAQSEGFDELFLDTRVKLRDEVGAYDGNMLSALKKLRCAADGSRSECAENRE